MEFDLLRLALIFAATLFFSKYLLPANEGPKLYTEGERVILTTDDTSIFFKVEIIEILGDKIILDCLFSRNEHELTEKAEFAASVGKVFQVFPTPSLHYNLLYKVRCMRHQNGLQFWTVRNKPGAAISIGDQGFST